MSIIFQNKGVIDRKSITAFGVSSKESTGAIGYFGTGLKYAIAILLRLGQQITIYSGKNRYVFGTRKTKVRVNEFNFVTMNGRALDFTTEVGKNWQLWQAFRELYCNCMDEGGEAYCLSSRGPEDDLLMTLDTTKSTYVKVDGEDFERVWDKRHEIILNTQPVYRGAECWIHPGSSQHLYYRGVRLYQLSRPSLYTYNIQTKVELTEDRTLAYPWYATYYLNRLLLNCEDANIVHTVTTASQDRFESALNFDGAPGVVFSSVVEPLATSFDPHLNKSASAVCRTSIHKKLKDKIQQDLPTLEKNRLAKAKQFLLSIGYNVDEFPIIVSEFLGENVLGSAHDGTIFISRRALMQGTKMVAGTLLEEWLHLKHHIEDESRTMQNWLLDALMTLGERVTGEPL